MATDRVGLCGESGQVSCYYPYDQREKLGEPPWSGPALEAWEQNHGHDARLKCLPEFGCALSYVESEDVAEALDAIDDYAAKDLDHDLHAIVEHYTNALGVKALRRGEATNREAQGPLPASVSAEDQPTTGSVG